MREMLFKGKALYDGEWVHGSLVNADDCVIIPQNAKRCGGAEFNIGYIVDPETVGQYTGLADKNGKKIFEGDIVKAKLESGNYQGFVWPIMHVRFTDGAFCLIDSVGRMFCALGAFATSVSFEVIGNIHDNPELMQT